ncbi:MAG: deoxyribose-phosphate aldolase [Legionella sp.]
MKLGQDYDNLLAQLSDSDCYGEPLHRKIIDVLDLTLLNKQATCNQMIQMATTAIREQVAAICIYPQHLSCIPAELTISKATVLNFPHGSDDHQQVLATLDTLIADKHIDELDYVFPYQAYLDNQQSYALSCCSQIVQNCKNANITCKVILETGVYPSLSTVYEASSAIINTGCDFLKTSTGTIKPGATLPVAFTLLKAICQHNIDCGIKLSGGITTIKQAGQLINLAELIEQRSVNKHWFRIGASTLLDNLIARKQLSN